MEIVGDVIWSGIFGSLGYGLLGYLITIFLLIILNVSGLLKRKKIISKILVVTYWIFIPIIFAFGFIFISALNYAKESTIKTADATITQFEKNTIPAFHSFLLEKTKHLSTETIIPSNEELVNQYMNIDSAKTNFDWIKKNTLIWFLDLAEEEAIDRISSQTGIENDDINKFRLYNQDSIRDLLHESYNKLKTAGHTWIDTLFKPYYVLVSICWIGLILFPFIEIVLARNRRRINNNNPNAIHDL